jgi:integrative and conjugative element protein (TIGR02256 family)
MWTPSVLLQNQSIQNGENRTLTSHDVVVDEVSTPQNGDRRSRFGFFRSAKHEQVARQRWLKENSTSAYLGLWHTHPERDPTPSGVDQRDWQQAIASDIYEGDRLFFPIVGTHCIRIWTLSRRGTFRELKLEINNAQNKKTAELSHRTRAGRNGY